MKKVLVAVATMAILVAGSAFACESNCTQPVPTKTTEVWGNAGIKVQGAAMATGDLTKTFSAGQYNLDQGFYYGSSTTETKGKMNLQGGYLAESAGRGKSYADGKAYSVGSFNSSFSVPGWNTGNH